MGFTTALKYKTAGKKRTRANVPHADPGPETKLCWVANTSGNPEDALTFCQYRSHPRMWGATNDEIFKNGQFFPYFMRKLVWPAQGNNNHQRVGASFRAKILRIKGEISVYDTVPAPIRIRMYYIYYKNHSDINNTNVTYLKDYTSGLNAAGTPAAEALLCASNYYHGVWKDMWMNEPDFFKTKLLEFYIKPTSGFEIPSNPITSQTVTNVVATAGDIPGLPAFSINRQIMVANIGNELTSRIPVDKTLYLNMSVNAGQDSHYLYFETDEPRAFNTTTANDFGVPSPLAGQGNVLTPLTSFVVHPGENLTTSPILFKFKTFYYFTDD